MKTLNNIEQLFKEHYPRMCRLATTLLHDDDMSRDIVHDVFVALLDSTYSHLISEAYLLKAVRNRCLNEIRNCDIRQRNIRGFFLENDEYDFEEWPDDDTLSLIREIVDNQLTSQQHQVIEMRFVHKKHFTDIAEVMNISETAVYGHMRRALISIHQKLNKNG